MCQINLPKDIDVQSEFREEYNGDNDSLMEFGDAEIFRGVREDMGRMIERGEQ